MAYGNRHSRARILRIYCPTSVRVVAPLPPRPVVLLLAVLPLLRRRRRKLRRRVSLSHQQGFRMLILTIVLATEKEESDEDMGFGLFD